MTTSDICHAFVTDKIHAIFGFKVESPACRTGRTRLALAGKMICVAETPRAAVSLQQFFPILHVPEKELGEKNKRFRGKTYLSH